MTRTKKTDKKTANIPKFTLYGTPEMKRAPLDELIEQASRGKRADSTFKPEVSPIVQRKVQAVYTGSDPIHIDKIWFSTISSKVYIGINNTLYNYLDLDGMKLCRK